MSANRRLAVLLLSLLSACAAAPGTPSSSPSSSTSLDCTLVLLKTGPRRDPLSPAERTQVFGGHMGNIQRLAREKQLLVAGPYGKEKSDPSLRGIFVLDTAERARAQALAETDPGVQAGVFALEYHDLSTDAPLRAFLAAELAAEEEARGAGREPAPGDGIRPYVLLTVDDGSAAAAALVGHPSVLLFGRLDRTRAFVVLDATSQEAAKGLLGPLAVRLGAFRLDDWFASGRLVDLPKLARG